MKFKDWADNYYGENVHLDKNQRDTLRDQLAGRVMLVLMLREWRFEGKQPRYKNRYLYMDVESHVGEDALKNDRVGMLYQYYMQNSQEEERIRALEAKWAERAKDGDVKAENKLEMERHRLAKVREKKKKHYKEYVEEKFNGVNIDLFEDVSDEESEFYKLLFEVIKEDGRGKSLYYKIKNGEWWVVSLENRKKILQGLSVLMKERKWYFVRDIYEEIVEKIINPKSYLLRKSMLDLIYVMDALDYYSDKEIIQFQIPEYETERYRCEPCQIEVEYNCFLEKEEANEYGITFQSLKKQIDDLVSKIDNNLNSKYDDASYEGWVKAKIEECISYNTTEV